MAWVEGLTNSQRILYTLASILTTSNKVNIKRWRKTVNGKDVDFNLEDSGNGVWKDKLNGNTVDINQFTELMLPGTEINKSRNWEVVYATGGATDLTSMEVNLTNNTKWDNVGGFDAKKIILKTVTTPVKVDASYDEYNTDPDSRVDSITMFLEIIKYRYAINPEENLEITVHPVTGDAMKLNNNHNIEMRYCDMMEVTRQYVIDKATKTEQTNMVVVGKTINTSVPDPQVQGQFIYKPLSEQDVKLYEVITEYGNRLLSKEEGGHPSEYAKYSWYIDYKEQLIDELDGGPSSDDISKGIALLPQIISGMSETMPIQFWINCDNDRTSMVLMGDPTIDYDKYLKSFCYIGKIDSFDGEGIVNDTAGNFALTVGSATVPLKKPKPLNEPIKGIVEIQDFKSSLKNVLEIAKSNGKTTAKSTDEFDATKYLTSGWYLDNGAVEVNDGATINAAVLQYVERKRVGYKFVAYSSDDETFFSNSFDFVYADKLIDKINAGKKGSASFNRGNDRWEVPEKGKGSTMLDCSTGTYTFTLKVPKPASKLKVYKILDNKITGAALPNDYIYGAFEPMYCVKEIDLKTASGVVDNGDYLEFTYEEATVNATVVKDKSKRMSLSKSTMSEKSVTRDPILHFVLQTKFPTTWGDQTTATGVNDLSMFKTRSGVYNQRHYASFITPEEYMRKDAFNPSRWTGKFHLSPTYVVHGYDGYRGWLKDTVIVDNTSIVHLDELIVNKDSKDKNKPQEIYKYFKLNAPFSFLNNSPNFNYGIGILKSKQYIDDKGNRITIY